MVLNIYISNVKFSTTFSYGTFP